MAPYIPPLAVPVLSEKKANHKEGSVADILERGDIFFVYKPKVETSQVASRDDVQRFYVIAEKVANRRKRWTRKLYAIGEYKLTRAKPEIEVAGGSASARLLNHHGVFGVGVRF
jgi:hypothetical protein